MRIQKLEERIEELEKAGKIHIPPSMQQTPLPPAVQMPQAAYPQPPPAQGPQLPPQVPVAAPPMGPPHPAGLPHPAGPPTSPAKKREPAFTSERLLALGGGLFVAIGVLFLAALAIQSGWIGPAGRTYLLLLGGVGLYIGGLYSARSRKIMPGEFVFGSLPGVLGGVGAFCMFMSGLVGSRLYDVFPDAIGLFIALIAAAAASALALLWHSPDMTAFGVLTALVAPLLLVEKLDTASLLFAVIALAGACAIMAKEKAAWLGIPVILLSLVQIMSWISDGSPQYTTAIIAIYAWQLLLIATIFFASKGSSSSIANLCTMTLSGMLAITLLAIDSQKEDVMHFVVYGLAFLQLIIAAATFNIRRVFSISLGILGSGLLAVGLILHIEGPTLSLWLSVECLMLAYLAMYAKSQRLAWTSIIVWLASFGSALFMLGDEPILIEGLRRPIDLLSLWGPAILGFVAYEIWRRKTTFELPSYVLSCLSMVGLLFFVSTSLLTISPDRLYNFLAAISITALGVIVASVWKNMAERAFIIATLFLLARMWLDVGRGGNLQALDMAILLTVHIAAASFIFQSLKTPRTEIAIMFFGFPLFAQLFGTLYAQSPLDLIYGVPEPLKAFLLGALLCVSFALAAYSLANMRIYVAAGVAGLFAASLLLVGVIDSNPSEVSVNAQVSLSIAWGLLGLVMLASALQGKLRSVMRPAAYSLLGLAAAKAALVDTQALTLGARTAIFICLGLLLLAAASVDNRISKADAD